METNEMIAVEGDNVKDLYQHFLGALTSAKLSRFSISHKDLKAYHEEKGISSSLKIKELTFSNRFYQATEATAERFKRKVQLAGGDQVVYLVRKIGSEKHVVRELHHNGKKLDHIVIGGWKKTGNGQSCRTRAYNGNPPCPQDCKEHSEYAVESIIKSVEFMIEWKKINDAMVEEMDFLEGNFTDRHFRELYERMLNTWGAIKFTAGLRFVPQNNVEELDELIDLFGWLEDHKQQRTFANRRVQEVEIFSIPVVNDGKRREMVEQSYELEATEEMEKILNEYKELKSKKEKVGTKKLNSWVKKYESAQRKKEHYEKILKGKMSKADSSIRTVNTILAQLMKSKGETEIFDEENKGPSEEAIKSALDTLKEEFGEPKPTEKEEEIEEEIEEPEPEEEPEKKDDIFGDLDDFLGI